MWKVGSYNCEARDMNIMDLYRAPTPRPEGAPRDHILCAVVIEDCLCNTPYTRPHGRRSVPHRLRISGCWRTAREGGTWSRGGEWVAFKKRTTPGTKISGSVKYFILFYFRASNWGVKGGMS
jgi:hypothetical protein